MRKLHKTRFAEGGERDGFPRCRLLRMGTMMMIMSMIDNDDDELRHCWFSSTEGEFRDFEKLKIVTADEETGDGRKDISLSE